MICPQCRLQLWRFSPQRRTHHPLRFGRSRHRLRHRAPRRSAVSHELTARPSESGRTTFRASIGNSALSHPHKCPLFALLTATLPLLDRPLSALSGHLTAYRYQNCRVLLHIKAKRANAVTANQMLIEHRGTCPLRSAPPLIEARCRLQFGSKESNK